MLFEQRGCPYCRELHSVNFARPEITGLIAERFLVVQLDFWGSRAVVDLDGEESEERELARKWSVNFTPTQVLMPAKTAGSTGLRQAEAFGMSRYFNPFHHLSGLEYLSTGACARQPFKRFLLVKFAELQAKGINPDVG